MCNSNQHTPLKTDKNKSTRNTLTLPRGLHPQTCVYLRLLFSFQDRHLFEESFLEHDGFYFSHLFSLRMSTDTRLNNWIHAPLVMSPGLIKSSVTTIRGIPCSSTAFVPHPWEVRCAVKLPLLLCVCVCACTLIFGDSWECLVRLYICTTQLTFLQKRESHKSLSALFCLT